MPPPPRVTVGENHPVVAKPTNFGRQQLNHENQGDLNDERARLLQLDYLDNDARGARVRLKEQTGSDLPNSINSFLECLKHRPLHASGDQPRARP